MTGQGFELTDADLLERIRIEDRLVFERAARDAGRWDEMAACYHPDAEVDISWFTGSGAAFVQASQAMAQGGNVSFHQIGQSVVQLRGDRATLDTDCTIHIFTELEGCGVAITSFGRLRVRMEKRGGAWLIAGLRGIYLRDLMQPLDPNRIPQLDEDLLAGLRPSYRCLAYAMAKLGRPASATLPGIDRPDLVQSLIDAERAWLLDMATTETNNHGRSLRA
ncbi:nuclear transport factor 2 family protein [Sphingosinithalassobacter portus]|uniref:nuclear transport factor 2 family protein n=1 Tax=Stakelama portus TaxID=2676234 RepID=UPI000D6E5980|nr:nuclear transport factor 2 family protein [Sphingosinithalassobacter portus]